MTPIIPEGRKYSIHERKEFPTTTGVYIVGFLNSTSGKILIGHAARHEGPPNKKGFRKRWTEYISGLKTGAPFNQPLERAAKKYGLEDIFFQVLEEVEPSRCVEREDYWIKFFNSNKDGYNIREAADSNLGIKRSKETCEKLKAAWIKTREKRQRDGIPFYQYDLEGNFIKEWRFQSHCCNVLGISSSHLSLVLKGTILTARNFYFSRRKYNEGESMIEKERREKSIQENTRRINLSQDERAKKNIKQLDSQGNLIKVWNNTREIANFYKIKRTSGITQAIKNGTETLGYKWTIDPVENAIGSQI